MIVRFSLGGHALGHLATVRPEPRTTQFLNYRLRAATHFAMSLAVSARGN
jgi:hypothetical protein